VIVIQNQVGGGMGRPVTTRSRTVAILLALFLGGLGVHRFYLGRPGSGILYLLFFWTLIPAVIALIEVIILLFTDDFTFARKYPTGYA
jgi:TM2 domain-containing membrane protein YozV